METLNRCITILKELNNDISKWGSCVDEFLLIYDNLTLNQRELLISETPAYVRYSLMNQYLEFFGREYRNIKEKELEKMIKNSFYLISLDNFEYDYRESILRVQKFINRAGSTFEQVWLDIKELMPKCSQSQINRIITWKNEI